MTSKFLEDYRLAEPTIRKLYDSGLRVGIVDALKDGPLRLADLRRVVNSNAPNTSSKAKELEEMGVLERTVSGDYALTPYGRAIRARAQESFEFYSAFERHKKFWANNVTDGIPDFLWRRLGDLNDSKIVVTTASNVLEVFDSFVRLLNSIEKKFYGVSPIYHDEYLKIVAEIVKKGIDTQLVLTYDILRTCAKSSQNAVKLLDSSPNCRMFATESSSAAFTVSEKFLSLGLKSKHTPGSYQDMDLQSTTPRAIQWGLDLFDYYMKHSTPVRLSDYL